MRITKDDLDENNYYKHSDKIECDEDIEVDEGLGYIKIRLGISSKRLMVI